jgi:hypothetical protein
LSEQPSIKSEDPLYPASDLHGIVGTDVRQAFDMRDVISRIVDGSKLREFKKEYGPTIITVRMSYSNCRCFLTIQRRALRIYKDIKLASWPITGFCFPHPR